MVGAVVGVQPFGGEGLSGTGPKAGGPLYLYRLLARRPADVMARALAAAEGDDVEAAIDPPDVAGAAARACRRWAEERGDRCARARAAPTSPIASRVGVARVLRRPDRRAQRLYAAAARSRALPRRQTTPIAWSSSPRSSPSAAAPSGRPTRRRLRARLPEAVQDAHRARRPTGRRRRSASTPSSITAARPSCSTSASSSAARAGPIVGVDGLAAGRDGAARSSASSIERALSVNTAAAGGNATLMTLQ